MILRLTIISLLVAALPSAPADDSKQADRPKPQAVDIVPADICAAIAIRDVAALTTRGDRLIEKTKIKVPMRLSDAYGFVTGYLGLKGGLDKSGAAALMICKPEIAEDSLVLAVPVGDFKAMAANFRLPRERLVEGKVIDRQTVQDTSAIRFVRYLAVRGDHVLMGGDPKCVEHAAKGRTLREALSKHDQGTIGNDDIMIYGNARAMKDQWDLMLEDLVDHASDFPAKDKEVLRNIALASQELHYAVIGLRLEAGLGATALLQFDGQQSRKILTRLGGTSGELSLKGLPQGRVIAAQAASGDGDDSAAVARALVRFLLKTFSVKTEEFVSAGHRANFVGVFSEGWQRLNGSRTALYENENPHRDGLFSLVAVLDTDDSGAFVSDMTGLARFINASGLSPDDPGESIDQKVIASLVRDLGDSEYRVRQLASTKLGLVGKPALPALARAEKSTDIEVRFRARAIVDQIQRSLAAQREDLLKRDLLSRIQPNFAYFPRREVRAERPVDFVQLRLQIDEQPAAAQLRTLLGPQWDKMRLATVDNHVVVLLGSNTTLFDKAITNLRSGKSGLQQRTRHGAFRKRGTASRTVEFHLALGRAQQLVARLPEPVSPRTEPDPTTSFGLSITPQTIRLDLFAPWEEVATVVKSAGW